MTIESTCSKARQRGRPRSEKAQPVFDNLVAAAKRELLDRVPSELTAKQIASAAGTTENMIQYYFGSKEQLSITVLYKAVKEVCDGLRQLKAEILHLPGNPTWNLFARISMLAEPHAATTRLQVAECLRKTSSIKEPSVASKANDLLALIGELITLLVDAGIYSPKLDVRFATFVFASVIRAPVVHLDATESNGLSTEDFKSDHWLGFCAGLFDQYFRNPIDLSVGAVANSLPGLGSPHFWFQKWR